MFVFFSFGLYAYDESYAGSHFLFEIIKLTKDSFDKLLMK